MDLLHFLNLQYWYCVLYSLFGGRCALLEQQKSGGGASTTPSGDGGFFSRIAEAFAGGWSAVWEALSSVISFIWGLYSALAWTVSTLLFLAILTVLGALIWLRLSERARYGVLPPATEKELAIRDRWNELLEMALSSDPREWREAILGADRMLGELLDTLGIVGATTPDKMRALKDDAFQTVPQAWEAHRIRNFVSNGTSDFILTQREAYRVMKLYEQVFEEHKFI